MSKEKALHNLVLVVTFGLIVYTVSFLLNWQQTDPESFVITVSKAPQFMAPITAGMLLFALAVAAIQSVRVLLRSDESES